MLPLFGQQLLRLLYSVVPRAMYLRAKRELRPAGVLDVGGGAGHLVSLLGCTGYHVVWELDEYLAQKAPRTSCVDVVVGDAHHLGLRSRSWTELVVFHESLHHFTNPVRALREAARILAPPGELVVFEFNTAGRLGLIIAMLEKAVGFPATFLKPHQVARLLEALGLQVTSVKQLSHLLYLVRARAGERRAT
jgi:ubiquinone/menaquinone biosynthesis C-methylase UbiE